MKKYVYGIAIAMLGVFITSCSNDDNKDNIKPIEQREGRFDKTAFTWDYSLAFNANKVFSGDHQYSVDGNTLKINSMMGFYLGSVFPKISIDEWSMDQEVKSEKNPYDIIFNFYKPFIVRDISTVGYAGYLNAFASMAESEEYKLHLTNSAYGVPDMYITECYTYEDVVKSFGENKALGDLFVAKMKEHASNTEYKSIYVMRLGKTFFKELFIEGTDGMFKKAIDEKGLYYIKEVTKGTAVTYVAVQSMSDYQDLKNAMNTSFTSYLEKGKLLVDGKDAEVLSKASITVLSPEEKVSGHGQWSSAKEDMYLVLNRELSHDYIGQPMYLDIRSVEKDEIYNKK